MRGGKLLNLTEAFNQLHLYVERHGSGVEFRTLDYENPGSNPVQRC